MAQKLCCPKCKSTQLQIIMSNDVDVSSTGGGYSAGKGCLGYLLMGPLGLLCGACGSKQKMHMQNHQSMLWVCKDCGERFRDPNEVNKQIHKLSNERERPTISYVLIAIISIIASTILNSVMDNSLIPLFILIFPCAMLALSDFLVKKQREAKIEELYHEQRYLKKNAYYEDK